MARIFISHSCKDSLLDDSEAQVESGLRRRLEFVRMLRDAVVAALADRNITTFFDQQGLLWGDPWRTRLRAWLGLCDGAVIFLSPEAVASDWVRYEADILTWRMWSRPTLRVIPVMVGLTVKDLAEHGFEPLQLEEIQASAVAVPKQLADHPTANEIARVASRVADCFLPAAGFSESVGDDILHFWAQRVSGQLLAVEERVPKLIDRACESLEIPERERADPYGRLYVLAHYLLQSEPEILHSALKALRPGFATDAGLKELGWEVLPGWVDQVAARPLAVKGCTDHPHKAPLFMLSPTDEWVLQHYAKRAVWAFVERIMARRKLAPFGEDTDEAETDLAKDLCRRTGLDEDLSGLEERDPAFLERLNQFLEFEPFFLGLPAEVLAHPALVQNLRDHYWGARMVLCGPPPQDAEEPADAIALSPPPPERYDAVSVLVGFYKPKP